MNSDASETSVHRVPGAAADGRTGVLETLRIPYTGSGVQASAIAIDKVFTKRIWETHKLPTPKYRVMESGDRAHLNEVADELRLPLIVKPPNEGSTIGISRVLGYSGMAGPSRLH